ncbi:MAG: SigB/SigF/SigG family RNA polymerase sigma factor [Clostridia bacterium]|nr:SigB/SigF/SigG family RNA polymerase sigma factor [Clostridia bacterium]
MLEQKELLEYIRKAKKGDNDAKEIVFTSNTPLIRSIVNKFRNKGIEYDDLFQIASMGFMKAITNFDEKFDVKFSTYCVPMIIGEIKRFIRDNGAIKVSRSLKILANKINRYISEFTGENNRSPSVEEVARKFDIDEDEVVDAIDSTRLPLSIYDKFDDEDDSRELIDKISFTDSEDSVLDKIRLKEIICQLNEREKKIVALRYFRDRTQAETAEELGVSQVQISRLENKILEKMRLNF